MALAALLLVAGGLLTWASSFVSQEVATQLSAQRITMPSGPAIENPEIKPYLEQYAGQPLTSIPVGVLALASRIASRGNFENTLTNFARLGYAPIPVDMAAQLAHTLFHLLAEGGVVSREVTCTTSICGRPRLASGRQYRPIACLSQKACSSAI